MQIQWIWKFLEQRTVRTLQRSKKRRSRSWSASFSGRFMDGFFRSLNCSDWCLCLVCLRFLGGIGNSFRHAFRVYLRCNQRKGEWHMATTKNLCAQISLDLHQKISEGKEAAGLTTAQYITNLLLEYYEMKENGGKMIMSKSLFKIFWQTRRKSR